MLVVSVLLAFNGLLLWVATAPRSLSAVTPYIESALSASDESYSVKIGETKLIWDGWKHPVGIHLYEIAVINKDGQLITNLPEISLGINVLYLPLGRIVPSSLTISSPLINLVKNDDGSISFGFNKTIIDPTKPTPEEANLPLSAILTPFLANDDSNNFRHLRRIVIKDAGVSIRNPKRNIFFEASGGYISFTRDRHGRITINSSANMAYKNHTASVKGDFSLVPEQKIINGTIDFSAINPSDFADIFADNKEVTGFSVPIHGKIGLAMNLDGEIQQLGFDLLGDKGKITSDQFTAPISVDSLQAQGKFANNLQDLEVTKLIAEFEGAQIAASITATAITANSATESPAIKADIVAKNVDMAKLKKLWPIKLAPETKAWVTENITSGKVPEAQLILYIKNGDLAKPDLPKEAVDANVKMENLKVRYIDEHPPLTNVNGSVHIDGVSLNAKIAHAEFLQSTKLTDGNVIIDDLNADNPYIKVDFNADAPASDIAHFLDLPLLKHAKELGLKEKEIAGKVTGNAKIGFNFETPKGKKTEDAITYDVKAAVSGLTQNGFLDKFDAKNIDGKVAVNNKQVDFSGKGEVSGAIVSDLTVKYLFEPEKGLDTFVNVKATADKTAIKRLDYPDFPFMKGTVGVVAKLEQGDTIERAAATLDLADTTIDYADIGWHKPLKQPATLELTSEKKNNAVTLPSFHLTGAGIEAKGSATISADFSGIDSLTLTKFSFDGSDISALSYAEKGGMTTIDITAKSLNLTPYMEQNDKDEAKNDGGFSFKNFPKVQLKADIGRVILGKNMEIANLKGDLNCDIICRNSNLSGATNNKPFSIKIVEDGKNPRQLAINSGDAGSFLQTFGVLDGMNGGILRLNGNYKESADGSTLTAKLYIGEHTVKDAPLLGKILSLASLTGFIDALQGNGIRFSELSMPFTLHNDVATIEKGKTHGSALGITVDGTITFPQKILDLQGTIVPAYSVNSVLGNVPFIGDKLMGGSGAGIFAANYSIKGKDDDAVVHVNPLSILTPGFLRGLFDVFDAKPKDSE